MMTYWRVNHYAELLAYCLSFVTVTTVMTDGRQTVGARDETRSSRSSGAGATATEAVNSAKKRIPRKPRKRHTVKLIKGPLCTATLRKALRKLCPIQKRPKDFPTSTEPIPVKSAKKRTPSKPRKRPTVKLIKGPLCKATLKKALKKLRPIKKYPKDFPTKPKTRSNPVHVPAITTPCPEDIHYQWQTNIIWLLKSHGGQTFCAEHEQEMKRRFIEETKPKKRGLLSKLKFWKKERKSKEDVRKPDSTEMNRDQKKSNKSWRKFCCL